MRMRMVCLGTFGSFYASPLVPEDYDKLVYVVHSRVLFHPNPPVPED
jgi:hypothetical protein